MDVSMVTLLFVSTVGIHSELSVLLSEAALDPSTNTTQCEHAEMNQLVLVNSNSVQAGE